ncbi:nuclear transport factor 2 family protein [Aquihabitans sp. G128]|uniref:limonene-1,2-epoxide hydrolase family protein n=1 Tax=Aquihabitans sp. G128 TaxID=2849779 RepID=UPI001C222560|nr:limonene-1,2-epoxide hydrolase family protein [Aquihabitans sp. G128]QXC62530.1 nuclear transport factor 2 family protein [Aquihabitans sp. G128]
MTTTPEEVAANVAVVEAFWAALGRRDFAAVGALMAPEGHYVDVPVLALDPGAFGPAETEARLRIGLEPLLAYELHDGPIVASGSFVVTEHSETWTWEEGLSHTLRFTSVQELADGKVARWWDYLDFTELMAAAPQWWLDHIAAGYK